MASQVDIVITAQDRTEAAFNRVKAKLESLQGSVRQFATSMAGGFAAMAAAYEAMRGVEDVTKSVYDNTVAWQAWQYTLTAGGLSSEETQKQLEFLSKTSMDLGLNIKDMGTSFSRFVLTGRTAGMSLETIDADFKAISEAMRIFHLSGQQATRSWLALNEVMAMGHLQSRQYTQQLGRDWAGIGPLLAKNFGEAGGSMAKFIELMKEGKITGQEFMDTFPKMMQTPAMQGALAGAVDSIQASMGRLQNAWFNLTNEAGNTKALDNATSALNELATTLSSPEFKQGFDSIITDVAEAANGLAKLLGPLEKLNQWAKSVNPFYEISKGVKSLGDSLVRMHLAPELNKLHNEMFQAQEVLNVMAENGEKGTAAYNAQAAALAALTAQYQQLQTAFAVASPALGAQPAAGGFELGGIQPLADASAVVGGAAKKTVYDQYTESANKFAASLQKVNTLVQENQQFMAKPPAALSDHLVPGTNAAIDALKATPEISKQTMLQVTEDIQQEVGQTINGIKVTQQMANEAIAKLQEDAGKHQKPMSQFGIEAARKMQDAMAQFFDNTHTGLRGMVRDFASAMKEIAAQILAQRLMDKMFGSMDSSGSGSGTAGFASFFASLFGHAQGGDVQGGQVSLVGERGPELFVPNSSGSIIPNNMLGSLGGGGNHALTINMDNRGAGPDEVAKLLAMRNEIINTVKGNTEFRLQRGSWRTTGATA